MAKIECFEDLECWQLSRELAAHIYSFCESKKLSKDYSLSNQIKRAAISVMNNIAEGFSRYSNKEFIRYLEIVHGSSAEIKSMLYLMKDLKYISHDEIETVFQLLKSIQIKIRSLIKYLRNQTFKPKHSNT